MSFLKDITNSSKEDQYIKERTRIKYHSEREKQYSRKNLNPQKILVTQEDQFINYNN